MDEKVRLFARLLFDRLEKDAWGTIDPWLFFSIGEGVDVNDPEEDDEHGSLKYLYAALGDTLQQYEKGSE